jgi:hypothetical protein
MTRSPAWPKQRRERRIAAHLAEREGKTHIRYRRGSEATVASVAGKERMIAEIFLTAHAIRADAAGVTEPWNADALTYFEPLYPSPYHIYPADDLMSGNNG